MNARFENMELLDWLGIPLGIVLALVGLMTLVGMPWQYADSTIVTIIQPLGAVLLILGGVGFAYYLYSTQ